MADLLLKHEYNVRIIDNLIGGREENLKEHSKNPNLIFEENDIISYNQNDKIFKDVEYVFHFAGIGDIVPSIENPKAYFQTNVHGTLNILECVRSNLKFKKFVYAASSSCYGLADTPTSEEHKINPLYPYALSKYQGEQICLHWHNLYKLPVNSIRIFNAYGTRSRTSGAYGAVFGVFLKQKLENKPFTVVGDGEQSRDFLYASDVANAFLLAAKTKINGNIFNLGAGNPQTINYLVQLLGGQKIYIPKRPGEPDCTWANIDKITKLLGWKQKVPFEKGVKLILDNIDYWSNAPLWDEVKIERATKLWFKYM